MFPQLGTHSIVPNFGNIVADVMNLIGTSHLTDYALERPEAAASLRALLALLRAANWKDRSCVERQFQAIARFEDDGKIVLDLNGAEARVALAVNYGVGLVRIVSVSTMDGSAR